MKDLSAILGTKVGLVGLGRSGLAAEKLLRLKFPQISIFKFDDSSKLADSTNSSDLENFQPTSLIVSPGYPMGKPWLQKLTTQGIPALNELDLASFFLTAEKSIGITGSVGKSTTAALIHAAATAIDPHAFLGGNFGFPLSDYVVEIETKKRPRAQWLIIELSSYHLETLKYLSFDLSILTYLTANHLERYSSQQEYYDAKWRLFARTKGPVVMNADSADIKSQLQIQKPIPHLHLIESRNAKWTSQLQSTQLIGDYNWQNLGLALETSRLLNWPEKSTKNILEFKGLPHRLENLGTLQGILFINDSKATSMESVKQAFDSVQKMTGPKGKTILLLGGRDKNLPWEELKDLNQNSRAEFIFFGESSTLAQKKSGLPGKRYDTLSGALKSLTSLLKKGDTCLLSPGGTSLDEFKNFEDRGNFFRRFVNDNF